MKQAFTFLIFISIFIVTACSTSNPDDPQTPQTPVSVSPTNTNLEPVKSLYLGTDLSYVNEIQDCGGIYKDILCRDFNTFFNYILS